MHQDPSVYYKMSSYTGEGYKNESYINQFYGFTRLSVQQALEGKAVAVQEAVDSIPGFKEYYELELKADSAQ